MNLHLLTNSPIICTLAQAVADSEAGRTLFVGISAEAVIQASVKNTPTLLLIDLLISGPPANETIATLVSSSLLKDTPVWLCHSPLHLAEAELLKTQYPHIQKLLAKPFSQDQLGAALLEFEVELMNSPSPVKTPEPNLLTSIPDLQQYFHWSGERGLVLATGDTARRASLAIPFCIQLARGMLQDGGFGSVLEMRVFANETALSVILDQQDMYGLVSPAHANLDAISNAVRSKLN